MTLKAKEATRIALEWRKLSDRAAVVRGRVEATPGAHMEGVMRGAENRIALRQMDKAKEALDLIDDKITEYLTKAANDADQTTVQAQDALLANNGVDTARTESGVGHRHGLLWLIAKKRVTGERRRAGEAWSNDYALVRTDSLRSCLNDNGPAGAGSDDASAARRALDAKERLACGRRHILEATGSGRLVDLLNAVCGQGETLRYLAGGDKDKAALLEVELLIALDMVAVSYQIVRAAA